SEACHWSTSRRISTERWRGGRCCNAATKASRIDSRAAVTSAGSPSRSMTRSSPIGCTYMCSGSWSPRTTSAVAVEGPISIGRARPWNVPRPIRSLGGKRGYTRVLHLTYELLDPGLARCQFLDQLAGERLGVTKEHHRLVHVVEVVVDAGEAGTHRAFDDHHR